MIDTLRALLLEYSDTPETDRRKEIEGEIWEQFGAERSVLIWDMSGFSLLTRRHGVIHYLSMVRRMQEITRPLVHDHGGAMVKFEADNGFAVFPDPQAAIRAAFAMNAAFVEENAKYPAEFDIRLACGIDHGRILYLEGRDFFGDAVNIASKLGEDLASAGEILVSRGAMDCLEEPDAYAGTPVRFSISGLELEAVALEIRPQTESAAPPASSAPPWRRHRAD